MPIILVVENTTDKDIENVELFDSLVKAFTPAGHQRETPGITIESCVAGISYDHIIRSVATGTVLYFEKTRLKFSYEINEAVLELRVNDIDGVFVAVPLRTNAIEVEDTREDKKRLEIDEPLIIDKTASVKLNQLKAGQRVVVTLLSEIEVRRSLTWTMAQSEKPEAGRNIVVDNGDGLIYGTMDGSGEFVVMEDGETKVEWKAVKRWAYEQAQ